MVTAVSVITTTTCWDVTVVCLQINCYNLLRFDTAAVEERRNWTAVVSYDRLPCKDLSHNNNDYKLLKLQSKFNFEAFLLSVLQKKGFVVN